MANIQWSRTERRNAKAATKLLEPDVSVYGCVRGRAKARVTGGVIAAIVVFAVAFLVALSQGFLLLPGVIMAVLLYGLLRPLRPVLITDRGVAIFECSAITDRPKKALVKVSAATLDRARPAGGGSKVEIAVGPEVVHLKKADFDRLAAAARQALPLAA